MMRQTQVLVIIVAIAEVIIGTCGNKNDVVFFNTGITSYRKPRSRNFFLDQPFIDKIIGQQTSSAVLARDQTIDQQALHSVSLKDQVIYPSGFPIFHHQPFKQNSVSVTTFKDEPLFREAALRNQESRGQQTVLRDNPLEGQSALLASKEIFEGQASTYRHQAPLKEQLFTAETPFKNLFQPFLGKQTSFQKQFEIPSISNSIQFYRDDPFVKPIDSYGRHKEIRTLSYEEPTMYTEYGNHALGLSSMPMISSSKHFLSLNTDIPTMPPSLPFTIYGSGSPMSSVSSSIGEVHSSEAFKMKPGPVLSLGSATSTSSSNCNALVDSSLTTSSGAVTTIPSISVNANQSSIVGHILTSLTTKPSSPAVATGIAPFVGNTLGPIHFHATKYGAILAPSFSTQNESKSNIHAYLLANAPKSSFKTEHHNFKYLIPESPKNDMKIDTQSPMLNYILTEEHKNRMKGIQNSFANYALPEGLKHNWSLQQFSQPETPSIAPLSLNGKAKHILSSIPVAPISTISWPMEIKTDVPAMLPAKSLMATDTATSNNANNLPLDMSLPLDFVTSIPNGLISSIPNSISESITGSISTSIPGGMTADMPASIPTLNLGQSLYRAEQLRQTQDARNPWYPTGLQLQLGDFGGINYTLHTSNPATRPIELEIAKASLIPPKLPQSHAPAFAKIGVGYHL